MKSWFGNIKSNGKKERKYSVADYRINNIFSVNNVTYYISSNMVDAPKIKAK